MVARLTGVVSLVESRGGNPCTSLVCQLPNVEDMIEVPMGDDDSANRLVLPTTKTKGSGQQRAASDEASIDEIEALGIAENVEVDPKGAHLQEVVGHSCEQVVWLD